MHNIKAIARSLIENMVMEESIQTCTTQTKTKNTRRHAWWSSMIMVKQERENRGRKVASSNNARTDTQQGFYTPCLTTNLAPRDQVSKLRGETYLPFRQSKRVRAFSCIAKLQSLPSTTLLPTQKRENVYTATKQTKRIEKSTLQNAYQHSPRNNTDERSDTEFELNVLREWIENSTTQLVEKNKQTNTGKTRGRAENNHDISWSNRQRNTSLSINKTRHDTTHTHSP